MNEDPKIYELLSSIIDELKETNKEVRGVKSEVREVRDEVRNSNIRLDKIEEQQRITNARLGAIEFVVRDEHEEFRSCIARVETALVQHGLMIIH